MRCVQPWTAEIKPTSHYAHDGAHCTKRIVYAPGAQGNASFAPEGALVAFVDGPDGITEVRTVEIVGLDLQADGGTHVKNTSEVGTIQITDYKSKGGINKRLYVELEE